MKTKLWKVYLFTIATVGSIVAIFTIGLTQKTVESNQINQQASLLPPQQPQATWITGFQATYLDNYQVSVTFQVDTNSQGYIDATDDIPEQNFFSIIPNTADNSISNGTDTYPYNVVIEQDPADIVNGIWTVTQTLDYSYWGPGTYNLGFIVESKETWYQIGSVTLTVGSWVSASEGAQTNAPMSTVQIDYSFTQSVETWDHVEFRFWKNTDQTTTTPVAETDAEGDTKLGGNDNGWVTLGKVSEGLNTSGTFVVGADQYQEGGLTPDTNYTLELVVDRVYGNTSNATSNYYTLAFDTSPGSKVIEDSIGIFGESSGAGDPVTSIGFNDASLEYKVYYEPSDAGNVMYSLWKDPNADGTIDANEEQDLNNQVIDWEVEQHFAQNKPTTAGETLHPIELGKATAMNPSLQAPLSSGTDYVLRIGLTHDNLSETVPTTYEQYGFRTDGVTPISNVQVTTSTLDEIVVTFDAAPSRSQEGNPNENLPGAPIAPAVQFRIYEADSTGQEVATVLDWTSVDTYINQPITVDGTYTLTIDNINGAPLSQVLVPEKNYVIQLTDQSATHYDALDDTGQNEFDFNSDGTPETLLGDNTAFKYASFPEVNNFQVVGTSTTTARITFEFKSAGHIGDLVFNVFQDANNDGVMTAGEEIFSTWQVFGTNVPDSGATIPSYEININDGFDTSTSDPSGNGTYQKAYTTTQPLAADTEYNFVFKTGTYTFYGDDKNSNDVITSDEEYSFVTEPSYRIGSIAQIATSDIIANYETTSVSTEFVWTGEEYTNTPIPDGSPQATPSNINLDYQVTTNQAYDNGVVIDWTTIASDAVSGTSYTIDTNVDNPGKLSRGTQYYMQARWYHDVNDNNVFDTTEAVGYISGTSFKIIIPDQEIPDVVKGDIELTASKNPTTQESADGQISYKIHIELLDFAAIANTVDINLYDNFGNKVASEKIDITAEATSNAPFSKEYTGIFGNGQGTGDVAGLKQGSYYATAVAHSKDGTYEYLITDGSDHTDQYPNTTTPTNTTWLHPNVPSSGTGVQDPSLLVQPYLIIHTKYEDGGTDRAYGTVEFGIFNATPGYSAVLDEEKSAVYLLNEQQELIPTKEVDEEGQAINEHSPLTPSSEPAIITGGSVFTYSISIQDGGNFKAESHFLYFEIYYDISDSTKSIYADDLLFDMSLALIIEEGVEIKTHYFDPEDNTWKIITTSVLAAGTLGIAGMSFVWVRNRKKKEYSKQESEEV